MTDAGIPDRGMMKSNNSKSYRCAAVVALAVLLVSFVGPGYCGEEGTALLLEMSPVEGGSVNVAPGVHLYDKDSEVKLVAVPKPGYQFVYWMGNVGDATTGNTTVFLDSPKMVIAVFERNKFETIGQDSEMIGGVESGGGLTRSGGLSDTSLEQAVSGRRQSGNNSPPDDVPVPVPEPVSAALFFAGALMLARSRRNGANITEET